MHVLITQHDSKINHLVDDLQDKLRSIRTGRASIGLIDNLVVNVYDSKLSLKEVASVNLQDPRTLLIDVWDKSILKDIEKSLQAANLGLSVVNDGKNIRVIVPLLTEETRKELVKTVHQKVENSKIALRQIRNTIKDSILAAVKSKEITEDEKYAIQKHLDDYINKYTTTLDNMGLDKEKEITRI